MAAAQCSIRVGSTKRTSTDSFRKVCVSWVTVPPYRWDEATISSPGASSVMSATNWAAMPLATATAPVAFSSEAIRSSNTAVVGFPIRV